MALAHTSTRPGTNHGPADEPAEYDALAPTMKDALAEWIKLAVKPAKTPDKGRSSYTMKQHFEHATDLYVTTGEFKGAMLAAGYEPVDRSELNWRFRARPACRFRRWLDRTLDGYALKHLGAADLAHICELATMARAEDCATRDASADSNKKAAANIRRRIKG